MTGTRHRRDVTSPLSPLLEVAEPRRDRGVEPLELPMQLGCEIERPCLVARDEDNARAEASTLIEDHDVVRKPARCCTEVGCSRDEAQPQATSVSANPDTRAASDGGDGRVAPVNVNLPFLHGRDVERFVEHDTGVGGARGACARAR